MKKKVIIGVLALCAILLGATLIGYEDWRKISTPGNPASGYLRAFADTTSGAFKCLTSAGASCYWSTDFAGTYNTGIVPIVNGGSGTSTPSLVAGSNVTISGSWPNQTVSSSGGGGGSLNPFGVGFTAPPAVATLNWVNQGGATAADQNSGIFMKAPASSGDQLRCLFKSSYPGTPYTFTIGMSLDFALANYAIGGIVVSDGTKFVTFNYGYSSGFQVQSLYWSSATAAAVAPFGPTALRESPLIWLRLMDDGTNFIFSTSANGVDFTSNVLFTVSRTAYLTPTKVGIFIDSNNASHGVSGMFLSWTGI